nr:hypothetical protein [Nitrospirota bacterium]
MAVTDVASFKVTVQGLALPHFPPIHSLNVDPLAGFANKVTVVPSG